MAAQLQDLAMQFAYDREEYVPQSSFLEADVGFGPYVVRRQSLLEEILNLANPKRAIHISGCKGAGKSTVLHQIAQILTDSEQLVDIWSRGDEKKRTQSADIKAGKKPLAPVYFFRTASILRDNTHFINALAKSKQEVFVLVDETQQDVNAPGFDRMLKNDTGHNITLIGAGVPAFMSASGNFKKKIGTERLFLNSDQLQSEGVVGYFSRGAAGDQLTEIKKLIEYLREYVGGHIYPLMWLSEQLVPRIKNGNSAKEALKHFESPAFRSQQIYSDFQNRILPDVAATNLRPLLYQHNPDENALLDLRKKGVCDAHNKVISQLLFQAILSELRPTGSIIFGGDIGGVQTLLAYALPKISWTQYQSHGGPVEDALTLEMIIQLSNVKKIETILFQPKLLFAGIASRRPDIYINSNVDCYVECVLTTGNNMTERKKLSTHIARFYLDDNYDDDDDMEEDKKRYYEIGDSSFAILNYQLYGEEPILPWEERFQSEECLGLVFTFLMSNKKLYRGDTPVDEVR